jgi:hypothetical protein
MLIFILRFKRPSPGEGFFQDRGTQLSESLSKVDRVFQIYFPMTAVIQSFVARSRFRDLQAFLDEWSSYLLKLRHNFSPFYKLDLKRLKQFRTRLSSCYFGIILFLFSSRSGFRSGLNLENETLNIILTNFLIAFLVFSTSILAMTTLMGLQTLRVAFQEVNSTTWLKHSNEVWSQSSYNYLSYRRELQFSYSTLACPGLLTKLKSKCG